MNDQAKQLRQLYSSSANDEHPPYNGQPAPIKTIAITSGKGGVGKTNICLNMGIALAKRGRKVLLVDADLNLGNLDVLLGLNPELTFRNVIAEQNQLRDIILKGPGGIFLAPATSGASELSDIKPAERRKVIEALPDVSADYDYVLYDTPSGIGANVFDFLELADSVFIITTPEPTAIIDAYAMIKLLWHRDSEQRLQLVVNYTTSKAEAEDVYRKLNLVTQHYLQQSITDFHFIVHDELIGKCVSGQQAFFERYPKSPAALCIDQIAEKIIQQSRRPRRILTLKQWMGGASEKITKTVTQKTE
jgi:flagellar biosynthesis protein FlhG